MILRREPAVRLRLTEEVRGHATFWHPRGKRYRIGLSLEIDLGRGRPFLLPPPPASGATYAGIASGRHYWLDDGAVYSTTETLTADDVDALVRDLRRRVTVALDRARARVDAGKAHRRHSIPDEVKVAVWRRDGGRCVQCGSAADLEYDHVIPVALGGSSTVRNLQLLCEPCNRSKGAAVA